MILAALTIGLISQTTSPLASPAFGKPISLDVKLMPLSKVAMELTRLTGEKVSVGGKIADRKVLIVADHRPAREIMERLASTLFCQWSDIGKQVRMDLPRDVGAEEANLVDAEATATRQLISDALKELGSLSVAKNIDFAAESLRAKAAVVTARKNNETAATIQSLEARSSALAVMTSEGVMKYVATALPQFGKAEFDTMMSGHTAFATYPARRSVASLPKEAVTTAITVHTGDATIFAAGAVAMLRYRPDQRIIEAKVQVTGLPNASGSTSGSLAWMDPADIDAIVDKSALGRRLKAWAGTSDPAVLTKQLASDTPVPKPGYTMQALSAADQLEWLSKKTGVPIVADAFRLPCSREQIFEAKDITDWLQKFNVERKQGYVFEPGYVRTEGGWLMWRHSHYWDSLGVEIPEQAFEPIERIAATRPLNLEDYANFAGSLTSDQATTFEGLFNYKVLVKFKAAPLRTCMRPIRLYGLLEGSQRADAMGKGVAYSNLTQAQQQAYAETLEASLWDTHVPESLLPAFFPGSGATVSAMQLVIESHPDESNGVNAYTAEALPPDGQFGASTFRVPGYRFLLGTDPKNVIQYDVGLPSK